jgi:uncharacterized protein (DUF2235 family)
MGLGLEENAEDAYSFIAHNYVEGDEIFILGFSRGAYTARFVGGLLGIIGILSREGMIHFKPIIEMYKASQSGAEFTNKLEEYKKQQNLQPNTWSVTKDNVNIKAVACWETVGAMGVPENTVSKLLQLNKKWDFLDTQLPLRKHILDASIVIPALSLTDSPGIEYAFQALGLDEHRSSFSPTLWWLDPNATWQHYPDDRVVKPELAQCWFPGTSPLPLTSSPLTPSRSSQRRRRRQPRPQDPKHHLSLVDRPIQQPQTPRFQPRLRAQHHGQHPEQRGSQLDRKRRPLRRRHPVRRLALAWL